MNDTDDMNELWDRLIELTDDFAGRLSVGVVIGTLEMVKMDIHKRSNSEQQESDGW